VGDDERELLVTSPPRSGTGSVAKALLEMGLNVGHEAVGRDGSVSSLLGFPSADAGRAELSTHLDGGLERFSFRRVARILRHPLGTIASLARYQNARLWRFVEVELASVDPALAEASLFGAARRIDRAARTWLAWEQRIEATWGPFSGQARTEIRIDDLPASLAPLAAWTGRPLPAGRFHEHPSQHARLGWQDLAREVPGTLYLEIVQLARVRGYV
jgi:hypothetical protein